jgi:hypothetical protein
MNRYAQIALEHHRHHRPLEHSLIDDPIRFFEEIGERIQTEVTRYRDEILGSRHPDETADAYRLRSYQTLAMAEELVLADHHLFQPETDETIEMDEGDPIANSYLWDLALINETIHTS